MIDITFYGISVLASFIAGVIVHKWATNRAEVAKTHIIEFLRGAKSVAEAEKSKLYVELEELTK